MKVLIACGGTRGHIFPGLSLASELKRRNKGVDILFVGSDSPQDKEIFRKANYNFTSTPARSMPTLGRKGSLGNDQFSVPSAILQAVGISLNYLKFLVKLNQAMVRSFLILTKYKPNVVVGLGGYPSVPILLSATWIKIPTLIHEQNVVPGRANRLLARLVDSVAVNFEDSRRFFKDDTPVVVTGNPVRAEILERDRQEALKRFDFEDEKFTILVMGGSQGAHKINQVMVETLSIMEEKDRSRLQIIHLTGMTDRDRVRREYERLRVKSQVFAFLYEMGYAYHAADLVVARSGATTTSEVTCCAKAAILIPYPYATGHQIENARVLEKTGGTIVMEEKLLSPSCLKDSISDLMKDREKLIRMGENNRMLAHPYASKALADEVVSLVV